MISPLTNNESFFIRVGNVLQRVNVNDIHWVQSDGNYCSIHTVHKKYMVKMPLFKIKSRLPENSFIQVHKSYIVHIQLIENIDLSSGEIFLKDISLPLGRKFKELLLSRLNLLQ